jgi:hypothetical protein
VVDGEHDQIFLVVTLRYFTTGFANLLRVADERVSPPPAPTGKINSKMPATQNQIIFATRRWLERAVIGLNLCPFAKAVHVKQQIRYVVSTATTTDALLDELEHELNFLRDAAPDLVDTTLLILPGVLKQFSDFADFLDLAEVVLRTHRLNGVLQIASFHPDYVFSDTDADDVTNCTNRSPYPMLHLLREASVSRATMAYPDAAQIFERNIKTLSALGIEGWRALQAGTDETSKDKI